MLPVDSLIKNAIVARIPFLESGNYQAFRLFNGFLEGCPGLVMDVYGSTLVIFNQANPPGLLDKDVVSAVTIVQDQFPWLRSGLLKTRHAPSDDLRFGVFLFGSTLEEKILEHGVWYALNLSLHQDASLYLDTRNVRKWAKENLHEKSVLNTFAYTGSLGVAAMAGGARRVAHLDLDRKFLNVAKKSYSLNGFPTHKDDFIEGDFFAQVSRMKRTGDLFDCVILDPPFFSSTSRSTFDLNKDSARLINKVRPLVNDGGLIVSINNSLYVSGSDYLKALNALCEDGYLRIHGVIDVPEDFTGNTQTRIGPFVTDPSPFNHTTKIAILEVKRRK